MRPDLESIVLIICVTILVILFAGEPDIHDAIIDTLMGACVNSNIIEGEK